MSRDLFLMTLVPHIRIEGENSYDREEHYRCDAKCVFTIVLFQILRVRKQFHIY